MTASDGNTYEVDPVRLREARRRAVMSRPELAAAAGMDRALLYRMERGGSTHRAATVRKLAAALRVPPAALVVGGQPSPATTQVTYAPSTSSTATG